MSIDYAGWVVLQSLNFLMNTQNYVYNLVSNNTCNSLPSLATFQFAQC